MAYTETKERNGHKHSYRTRSVRKGDRVVKERIFMGTDLTDEELARLEKEADMELKILSTLLLDDEIEELEKIRERHKALDERSRKNRYEAFLSRFTHDSTAIEGNTLTLQETAGLLFEGLSPPRKHLREINEVLNHRKVFDRILEFKGDLSREMILEMHEIMVKDTLGEELEDQIGRYRDLQVYIRGVEWIPPSPEDVPQDMKELLSWYSRNREKLHPLIIAVYFHVGFETIHPFVDGNGRVGRMLLNFILLRNGYPLVNIPVERKLEYYECLEKGQVEGDLRPFILFLMDIMRSSDMLF